MKMKGFSIAVVISRAPHAAAVRALPEAEPVGTAENNFQNLHTFCKKYAIMPYESTGCPNGGAARPKHLKSIGTGLCGCAKIKERPL